MLLSGREGSDPWRHINEERPAGSNAAVLLGRKATDGLLEVTTSSDIFGSVFDDTIVQRRCSLHIRGDLLGSLTIEPGAEVVIDGSVDGKIINRGAGLLFTTRGLRDVLLLDGPREAEACGVLKINLTAIASNWETMAKRTNAECAAVVKGNAYGCGIDPIARGWPKSGCKTFFVSNLPEAKRVRAVAPNSVIYVLNGLTRNGAGLRGSQCATGYQQLNRNGGMGRFRRIKSMEGWLRGELRHGREQAWPFDGRGGRTFAEASIREPRHHTPDEPPRQGRET